MGARQDIQKITDRLERRVREATERHEADAELADVPTQDRCTVVPFPAWRRGRPARALVKEAQLSLFDLAQDRDFTIHPMEPSSEFPTFLTRLPIFLPTRRTSQAKLVDADFALPFECSWGKGRKYGAPVTVYDEDTLMALLQLREHLLLGDAAKLPIPLSEAYRRNPKDVVQAHALFCMVTDVQTVCERSPTGASRRRRLESIRRLASLVFEFERIKSAHVSVGRAGYKLLDVAWERYEENAILYVQFTPFAASCLDTEYTYINWELRQRLSSALAKAVHRFLSSQRRDYQIQTEKLARAVGFHRPAKYFLAELRAALRELQTEGWLESYEIVGTGRNDPHILTIKRTAAFRVKKEPVNSQ